jgi:MHS family alpha-ketoglutarate permease-like MFS transporter
MNANNDNQKNNRHTIFAGAIGNLVEWYDWTIYGLMASVFAKQFFPANDPTTSLLVALLAFAGGYLARPVGSFILSPLADKYGRKRLLSLTILIMGAGSLIIAACPTYASIGIAAPILVVLARLMQGFSAGAEFQGSTVYLVEHAPTKWRALYSSVNFLSTGLAILLATGVSALVTNFIPQPDLASYGWRLPFLAGAIFSLYGLYIRRNLPETPTFKALEQKNKIQKSPILQAIVKYPRASLTVFGIQATTAIFYTWTVFLPGYANLVGKLPISQGLAGGLIALCVYCLIVPISGYFGDRIGRRPILLVGSFGFVVLSYPLLRLLEAGTFQAFLVADVVGCVLLGMLSGVISPVFCELFPAEVRTSGIGIPYALSSVAFGAMTPLIATYFIKLNQPIWVSFYMTGVAVLIFLTYASIPETRGRALA